MLVAINILSLRDSGNRSLDSSCYRFDSSACLFDARRKSEPGLRFALKFRNLLVLLRRNQVQVSSGSLHHQRIGIVFVILAAKRAMVHETQIHALARGFIKR